MEIFADHQHNFLNFTTRKFPLIVVICMQSAGCCSGFPQQQNKFLIAVYFASPNTNCAAVSRLTNVRCENLFVRFYLSSFTTNIQTHTHLHTKSWYFSSSLGEWHLPENPTKTTDRLFQYISSPFLTALGIIGTDFSSGIIHKE